MLYIHGGDSFSRHGDFLEYLRTRPVRNLPDKEPLKIWTETLEEDLGEEFELFRPSMPNKQNANYEEWKIWFERHFEYLRDGVILVGWSLGGMFLVKYLSEESLPVKISALHLLGAPCGKCEDEGGNDCGSFQFDPERLVNLEDRTGNITLWHSKDDFVVPYDHVLLYKERLEKAKLVTYEDKNHFLIADFNDLISSIKRQG